MNVDNIRRLAARLREPDAAAHFDLSDWIVVKDEAIELTVGDAINHCGTVACIAGWACVIAKPDGRVDQADEPDGFDVQQTAAEFLGLNWDQSWELFCPSTFNVDYSSVTSERAAQVLDRLAETGEVVW